MAKEISTNLVAGKFRPETAVAKMFTTLKASRGKVVPFRKLEKLAGETDLRGRLYRLRRAGKKGPEKWALEITDNGARLLPSSKKAA